MPPTTSKAASAAIVGSVGGSPCSVAHPARITDRKAATRGLNANGAAGLPHCDGVKAAIGAGFLGAGVGLGARIGKSRSSERWQIAPVSSLSQDSSLPDALTESVRLP